MQTDDVLLSLNKVIDDMIKAKGIQEELDLVYENLCTLIYTKMQRKIPCVSDSKKLRKRHKPSKPFWSDNLSELWSNLREADKNMKKCKCIRAKRIYKEKFVLARHTFDREYRKAERHYNCGKMIDIDTICVNNPNEFWDCLKKLAPHRKYIIPIEIYDNNIISCNITQVLEKWKKRF